jgi:hypothetical protein
MRRYADEQRQTPLAVSLHAATDEERDKLIPVNRRWPIAEVLDACRYVVEKTGRRITFEWALIAGENDTIEQAQALGKLVQGMLCHVNLIPLNPTAGYGGAPSVHEQVDKFQEVLTAYGVSSTVRVRRGIDIQAGCRPSGVKLLFACRSSKRSYMATLSVFMLLAAICHNVASDKSDIACSSFWRAWGSVSATVGGRCCCNARVTTSSTERCDCCACLLTC